MGNGSAVTLVVLENSLYHRHDRATIDALLHGVKHIVALDFLPDEVTEQAEVVLPSATSAEADGSLVNNEGRLQHFYQVFAPAEEIQASWRWLMAMQYGSESRHKLGRY